jgi:hypothetical protein
VNFRALATELHGTAEEVARFFKEDRGLSHFKVEEPVADDIDYRPTLQALTPEKLEVWIEISVTPYPQSLDSVVLHCVTNSLPVRIYVGFPAGLSTTQYKSNIDDSRRKGVGAVEVSGSKCQVIHEALSLSLIGVRCEDHRKFPPRYRSVLSSAESTFRNGDPAKGCSLIYDEIEGLSRRLVRKINDKNLWGARGAPTGLNFDKAQWARIMEAILDRANTHSVAPKLSKSLLNRIAGMTEPRNESGHKPRNREAYTRRDREARTRFESAVDTLREFAAAARPLVK